MKLRVRAHATSQLRHKSVQAVLALITLQKIYRQLYLGLSWLVTGCSHSKTRPLTPSFSLSRHVARMLSYAFL